MHGNVIGLAEAGGGAPSGLNPPRVLIYSHDTFGLGHIRRCRAIANSLMAAYPHISIVIVSGSPMISSFQFSDGVDYVRVPGIEKRNGGDYAPHRLNLDLAETLRLRADLIRQTALSFDPDVVIVDKEPLGLRGELLPALDILHRRGARIVLGVRDVLDDPDQVRAEWQQSGAFDVVRSIYDDVFVYGLESIYQPLQGLCEQHLRAGQVRYTGYLKRTVPSPMPPMRRPKITKGPFILVTTGGGGDGMGLIDWVISAYESDPTIVLPALIVFGPFMSREARQGFVERIARLPKLESIGFEPRLELWMNRAHCVVAMGGYNTFCEILSFDKPALLVPRTRPRREQIIRAAQAERHGLVRMLPDPLDHGAENRDPAVMAAALHLLPTQAPPSQAFLPGLLDGLPALSRMLAGDLALPARRRAAGAGTAASR